MVKRRQWNEAKRNGYDPDISRSLRSRRYKNPASLSRASLLNTPLDAILLVSAMAVEAELRPDVDASVETQPMA